MKPKKSKNPAALSYVKMYAFSMLAAALCSVVFLAITALLMDKAGIGEKQAEALVCITYVASAFTAGILCGKWKREKKFLWGGLAGMLYFLLLCALSLYLGQTAPDMQNGLTAFIFTVCGGMLGGMLA